MFLSLWWLFYRQTWRKKKIKDSYQKFLMGNLELTDLGGLWWDYSSVTIIDAPEGGLPACVYHIQVAPPPTVQTKEKQLFLNPLSSSATSSFSPFPFTVMLLQRTAIFRSSPLILFWFAFFLHSNETSFPIISPKLLLCRSSKSLNHKVNSQSSSHLTLSHQLTSWL